MFRRQFFCSVPFRRRFGARSAGELVDRWRNHGHLLASVNPLAAGGDEIATPSLLQPDAEMPSAVSRHVVFWPDQSDGSVYSSPEISTEMLLKHLRQSWAGSVGVHMAHVEDPDERLFLARQFETAVHDPPTEQEHRRWFRLMDKSQSFDRFVHKKLRFVKRYGLEGVESMMVAMDSLFESAARQDITDVVIGMPHRGRLNLLSGLLEYPERSLFMKMRGRSLLPAGAVGTDDVLSHVAQSVDLTGYAAPSGHPLHVSLIHNPSHLETVCPVAVGKARAKQDRLGGSAPRRVMPVLMHGDASIAGQGVVAETLLLSRLPGYQCSGTVHLVVNNQLGFTTPSTLGRSGMTAADVAKLAGCPIVRVNAEDPPAVHRAVRAACAYNAEFGKDVFIDLVGYRRHGHNELDDPTFTQPRMYDNVHSRASAPDAYAQQLVDAGVLTEDQVAQDRAADHDRFEGEYQQSGETDQEPHTSHLAGRWWQGYVQGTESVMRGSAGPSGGMDTGVDGAVLCQLGHCSVDFEAAAKAHGAHEFAVHPRLVRGHVEARRKRLRVADEDPNAAAIDWATAEALAHASLLREGFSVRLTGQDVGRGTFSHRHAELHCQSSGHTVVPLATPGLLSPAPGAPGVGHFAVVNSPLSEYGCLGFEYGYSLERPDVLAIWEAQFGDFVNTAQVVVDTCVSSGEDKWLRQSGLVLQLPHGADGAGPEHSSCRLERFLSLYNGPLSYSAATGADGEYLPNWSVINPSTPANFFHALRRQLHRPFRKPLVVAAPKTLLRHAQCVSPLAAFAPGTSFQPVLDDPLFASPSADRATVEAVLLCSGKMYYDLVKERETRDLDGRVAIVRLEELCPFPFDQLDQVLASYGRDSSSSLQIRWCQEEHENQGAFQFVYARFMTNFCSVNAAKDGGSHLAKYSPLQYAGPEALSSPAVSNSARFQATVKKVFDKAFQL